MRKEFYLNRAVQMAKKGLEHDGGPFGAVIVRGGEIIAEAYNEVTLLNDPTAHAEIMAIRKACDRLGTYILSDCTIYCSSEPCSMCMSAIYWARIPEVYFANAKDAAGQIGFKDEQIYRELALPHPAKSIICQQIISEDALQVLLDWRNNPKASRY